MQNTFPNDASQFPSDVSNTGNFNSSVPIGSFAAKTKGKKPRSREATSREATSRVSDADLAHYMQLFEQASKGKTYMPPEATPPGFVGMWVRTAVQQKTCYGNVENRMKAGWLPPSSDKYPKIGFLNVYGDVTDDKGVLTRPGLLWMLRPIEIHELEMRCKQKKVNDAARYKDAQRQLGVEGGFMTARQNLQTVTFTDNAQAQYIAGLFGK
jgi:hypothetical protein